MKYKCLLTHNYSFVIVCNSFDMDLIYIPVSGFIKLLIKLSQE